MNDKDLKKIGDEMIRVLQPVYEQLDGIEEKLDRMEQKQDVHTADIIELQKKADLTNDRFVRFEEKLTVHIKEDRKEHSEIRGHIGLSVPDTTT